MSDSELAAASWPYENGSSTIGVKKSTVCTSARWRSNRYTPASSNVFELTTTFRFNEMGSCGKTCRRACWLSLDAHPAQDESDVSLRICSRDMWFTSFVVLPPAGRWLHGDRRSAIENRKCKGGEDRNRTYLATCVATTVLKTARATRHPSLSGLRIVDWGLPIEFFVRPSRFGMRRFATGRIRGGELDAVLEV